MLYSDLTTALGVLLVIPITNAASATPSSNTDFNNFLPRIIENAELRIKRELDFIAYRAENTATSVSPARRLNTFPATIIVMQSANIITPTATLPIFGTRIPLEIVSKDFIDATWPNELTTGVPKYIAQLNATTFIIAPTPVTSFYLEITGIFQTTLLSFANTSTYISMNYPDLMLYASMVIACGYQRDFGQQADDPKIAMTWETMYQQAKQSSLDEEQRRKSQSTNWSPFSATPLSTPRK